MGANRVFNAENSEAQEAQSENISDNNVANVEIGEPEREYRETLEGVQENPLPHTGEFSCSRPELTRQLFPVYFQFHVVSFR